MSLTPIPTPHDGLFVVHTTSAAEVGRLSMSLGVAPMLAIANPTLARLVAAETGDPPMPESAYWDALTRAAVAAGVPPFAVLTVALAMVTVPAGVMPAFLAAIPMPPTWIVGTPAECAGALRAAEAALAAAPNRKAR